MKPEITVGMIVFNAESTLPKNMLSLCIENIHPFVKEIIIVEGATHSTSHYWDGHTKWATKNGQSNDGTIEKLHELESKYKNLKVIYGNGFWDGKTSMCNEYAKIATGNYILQLDSDEFYKHEDMERLIRLMESTQPDQIDFYAQHFVGGFNLVIDNENGHYWGNNIPWSRIFKNVPGRSFWERHEPPIYSCNNMLTNAGKVIGRNDTMNMGIWLYHYSYVVESQFRFKANFYGNKAYMESWNRYQKTGVMNIFDIEPIPFHKTHPEIIAKNYLGVE